MSDETPSQQPDERTLAEILRDVVEKSATEPILSQPQAAPSPAPVEAKVIVDEVPLASQKAGPKSILSSRIGLLLVAGLIGGLAGHYASGSSSSGNGLTIQSVTNSPGAAILPNGQSIPKLIQRLLPSVVSIDVQGNCGEDQGTGMIISSNGLVITHWN